MKNTDTGYEIAAHTEPREIIFDNKNKIKNTLINTTKTRQSINRVLDHAVKIPLPPRKLKKHGNICPKTHIKDDKYNKFKL